MRYDLGFHGDVAASRTRLHGLVPVVDSLLYFRDEAAALFPLQPRDQFAQYAAAVTNQSHFHRKSQPNTFGIELNLNSARLVWFWHEFEIGERTADHQERVAFFHRVLRRLGA